MLALWVGFVLSLLLVLVPSLYTSCIPLGVLFNTIAYQSKKYHAGSFSRSAVNHESGAKTGLAGIVTGIIMGCALQFLTPLFTDIPQVSFLHLRLLFCFVFFVGIYKSPG